MVSRKHISSKNPESNPSQATGAPHALYYEPFLDFYGEKQKANEWWRRFKFVDSDHMLPTAWKLTLLASTLRGDAAHYRKYVSDSPVAYEDLKNMLIRAYDIDINAPPEVPPQVKCTYPTPKGWKAETPKSGNQTDDQKRGKKRGRKPPNNDKKHKPVSASNTETTIFTFTVSVSPKGGSPPRVLVKAYKPKPQPSSKA